MAEVHTEVGVPDAQESAGLPQLDPSTFAPQLVWLLISFGVLYFFMARSGLPKITGVLEDRSNRIQHDLDDAERMRADADAVEQAYEKSLAEARAQATSMIEETRNRMTAQIDASKAELEARLAKDAEAAEVKIMAAKEATMANLEEIATETCTALVEKLIGSADGARVATAVKAGVANRNG